MGWKTTFLAINPVIIFGIAKASHCARRECKICVLATCGCFAYDGYNAYICHRIGSILFMMTLQVFL